MFLRKAASFTSQVVGANHLGLRFKLIRRKSMMEVSETDYHAEESFAPRHREHGKIFSR